MEYLQNLSYHLFSENLQLRLKNLLVYQLVKTYHTCYNTMDRGKQL